MIDVINNKIGFYGITPVVQQLATTDLGVLLSNLGLRVAGTAYPITTTGTATLSNIVLPTNGRINLTLPTTNTHCTGNMTDSFQSGYTAAAGDLVFYGTGGKWLECDADGVATCACLLGIALEAKNDTEAMRVALPGSMVNFDAWTWTIGDTLYASNTLGGISNTKATGADSITRVIGYAIDADTIFFMPESGQQVNVA